MMYILNKLVIVVHSLFLRKWTVVKCDLWSIQVMKYLYSLIDVSKRRHTSDETMSLMLLGSSSIILKGPLICFPNGQLIH